MKTISRLRYFLYLSILIVGCTTGKNALQKGNYDASVSKAVERLKSSPKNEEAKQVLAAAYDLALRTHLRAIDEAKISASVLRWEAIVASYQQINQLGNEINSCSTCLTVVSDPKKFVAEVEEGKYKAAEARYTLGINAMKDNNRESAKKAYHHFERAQQFFPTFKDVQAKINEAYWAAVVKVVVAPVQVNSDYYREGNQLFEQQVNAFINNYQQNRFVVFYTADEAAQRSIVADQVLNLRFADFSVGQTYVKERVEKIKRDSVIVGQTRNNKPIYGTVKATLSFFDKKISSSGLLTMSINDMKTNQLIKQKQLAGTYIWEDQWVSYKGDDRALTSQQLKQTRKREMLPPAPNALFAAFTRPIYAQLVDEIGYFYRYY